MNWSRLGASSGSGLRCHHLALAWHISELEGTLSQLRKFSPQRVSVGDLGHPASALPSAAGSSLPAAAADRLTAKISDASRTNDLAATTCAPPGPTLRSQARPVPFLHHAVNPLWRRHPGLSWVPITSSFIPVGWGFQASCHHRLCCFWTHTCLPTFFWKCGSLNKDWVLDEYRRVCVCVYKILF